MESSYQRFIIETEEYIKGNFPEFLDLISVNTVVSFLEDRL